LDEFVLNDLSRWYIKIIRDRTWVSSEGKDKEAAILTLYMAISELAKMMAPFAPFIGEYVFRETTGGESVFLEGWPVIKSRSDLRLERQMELAKEVVEQINAARDEAGIKLRWPVDEIVVESREDIGVVEGILCKLGNSKKVCFGKAPKGNYVKKEFSGGSVFLNKERAPDTINEGLIRDLMRQVQNMRKKAGLRVDQYVALKVWADEDFAKTIEGFKDEIISNTSSRDVVVGVGKPSNFKEEARFEGKSVWLDYNL
jgi:isoleucyl-tRNA synthetase